MLIYTSKNNHYNIENSYLFKIYDKNAKILKNMTLIMISVLIYSLIFPAPSNYLALLKSGISLKSIDNIYDYTVPLIAVFILFFLFYEDYNKNVYKFYSFFYKNCKYSFLYRYLFYLTLFCIGIWISGIFYYRNSGFLSILLSLRFLPNIFFLTALYFLILAFSKNNFISLFIVIFYFMGDFLSAGRFFNIFSIGMNSNNSFYLKSEAFFIINRLLLMFLSIIFIYIASNINKFKSRFN